MIRDGRMQQLVVRDQEPITAFVDRVRQLHDELGVSTVLVMGGSGDYFDVADCIIQMADFEPRDVTKRARDISSASPSRRTGEGGADLPRPRDRAPDGEALRLEPSAARWTMQIDTWTVTLRCEKSSTR